MRAFRVGVIGCRLGWGRVKWGWKIFLGSFFGGLFFRFRPFRVILGGFGEG